MIISVLSPVHGQAGNTTVALLAGLLLSKTKKVCLTHLSASSTAFYSYLGLEALEDPTCSPSQVASMLHSGVITPSQMGDYCKTVNEQLDIFSNAGNFSEEDMATAVRYITDNMPHDFTVVDIDINMALPLAQETIEKSDLIIMPLTQSNNVFGRYAELFEKEKSEIDQNKVVYFCNHYTPEAGSSKAFSQRISKKRIKYCYLHHSETLFSLSNEGKMADILKVVEKLPDIQADFQRFEMLLLQIWKNAEQKRKEELAKAKSSTAVEKKTTRRSPPAEKNVKVSIKEKKGKGAKEAVLTEKVVQKNG